LKKKQIIIIPPLGRDEAFL